MTWGSRSLWIGSIVSSVVLLALVLVQIDWAEAAELARAIDYAWIAIGLALQFCEGLISASRFKLMSRRAAPYRLCLRAVAWYVLFLILLPARLGEVAGIALITRHMRESAGAATASLIFQRLFDIVFLLVLLAALFVVAVADIGVLPLLFLLICVLLLSAFVYFFDPIMSLLARALYTRRRERWPRRAIRLLLQARGSRRHHLTGRRTATLGVLTLLKWLATLGAVSAIAFAVVPALPLVSAIGIGVVYNLSAAIPLQTVGGFGISEAALLGSFHWLGYSITAGASIAVAMRLALIIGPILFWFAIISAAQVAAFRKIESHGR